MSSSSDVEKSEMTVTHIDRVDSPNANPLKKSGMRIDGDGADHDHEPPVSNTVFRNTTVY